MAARDRPKKESYEVGYRKPPVGTRFKKGQSGNPAGRPRGTVNLATLALGGIAHGDFFTSVASSDTGCALG